MWIGVAVGGALGALARYWVGLAVASLIARGVLPNFPFATLAVNVVGSFMLSLLVTLGLSGLVSPQVRLAVGTGFVGALTTFSTFEVEADALLRQGAAWAAAAYVLGNLLLGYAAVLAGRWVGELIASR